MAAVISEVLNNLVQGNPELVRALTAILPRVQRVTLSPALIGQGTSAEQTFTVNGVEVGDTVYVSKPTAQAGLSIGGARVTARNTVAILFVNTPNAGGNITPTASETYNFAIFPGLVSSILNQVP